jgi:hypothetical protein
MISFIQVKYMMARNSGATAADAATEIANLNLFVSAEDVFYIGKRAFV